MPDKKVYKIDVGSPLIRYEGNWGPGPDIDPEKKKYDKDSYVFCAFGEVCSATLEFTGKEIHVVGAYRPPFSGPIQVELDGKLFGPLDPGGQNDQFKIDLFNATDLQPGMHTLKLSTVPSTDQNAKKTVSLDYFTWTSEVASLSDTRIQDDSAAFVYEPKNAWKTDLSKLPGFDDGNGHYAVSDGTATFTFSGDRIALLGAIGQGGGPFTAQVDNGPVWNLTTQNEKYSAEQVIFSADGYSSGNHTVKIVAQPGEKQIVAIDYAIVDAKANGDTVTSASASSLPESTSTMSASNLRASEKGSLTTAQIGGIAGGIAVLVLLLLAALAYVLYLRRVKPRKAMSFTLATPTPFSPAGQPPFSQFVYNRPISAMSRSSTQSASTRRESKQGLGYDAHLPSYGNTDSLGKWYSGGYGAEKHGQGSELPV